MAPTWIVSRVALALPFETHGYTLVQLGVSQETALGWEIFDIAAFAAIGLLALGASFLVVDRRRPA